MNNKFGPGIIIPMLLGKYRKRTISLRKYRHWVYWIPRKGGNASGNYVNYIK
jgi:hypothetical protein